MRLRLRTIGRRLFGGGGRLRKRAARALDRHVIDAWFPRCLDSGHGGFLCDFDAAWRPGPTQVKLLEFQARQTRVAALVCRLRPGDPAPIGWCRHGLAVLRETMWDGERGGFHALCARDGTPLAGGDKHGHGTAYAIHALVDVARTLDEPAALELAREALAWFDDHAWDRERGGFWGWLRADGTPYASIPDQAAGEVDQIGTPLGAKDTNVNGDTLEALTALVTHFGDRRAAERLSFLLELFERLVAEHGCLPANLTPALDRLDDVANAGNSLQASYRLPAARAALGRPHGFGELERSLRSFADRQRGATGGIRVPNGEEQWWAQFEYLRSAATAAALDPDSKSSAEAQLEAHWTYLEKRFVDPVDGGIALLPRTATEPGVKGTRWKDASHDASALAAVARLESVTDLPSRAV